MGTRYEVDIERFGGVESSEGNSNTCKNDRTCPAINSSCSLDPSPSNVSSFPTHTPYFKQTISSSYLFHPLLVVTLTTGLLDASTCSTFSVFASNQTGNAILLTLAAVNSAPVSLHNTAASLGAFLGCALIAGTVGNRFGPRNRGWMLISNIIQLALLILVAILSAPQVNVLNPSVKSEQWISLLLLAGSAGFQVAMAKTSGVGEVPTAMLTSPFVEFVTDKHLFEARLEGDEVKCRNRRGVYIVTLLTGSLVGAYMHRYTGGGTSVLILSIVLRAGTTLYMAMMPEKTSTRL